MWVGVDNYSLRWHTIGGMVETIVPWVLFGVLAYAGIQITRIGRGMTKILLIQGANMAWLGRRQPEIYGTTTANQLDQDLQAHAAKNSYDLEIFYTHLEGEAIGRVYQGVDESIDGLVMNPAGFTYRGEALRDCILACGGLPYIEVHISNLGKRDIKSALVSAADGMIMGFGLHGYVLALDGMLDLLKNNKA